MPGSVVTAANYPTLANLAKRLDPDNTIADIVELLDEDNPILKDAPFVEGNLPTGHRTTVRTGLPSVTWRKLNYGVTPSKSSTQQVDDTCGMLEAYAEVDKKLADLNGNTAEFRLSEDRPFIQQMNQTMASTLFYGDTDVNPERFLGLDARYPGLTLTKPTATTRSAYLKHVYDMGGSGSDLTSMWLVCWGPNTVHMIYPKGSKLGLQHQDLGEQTLYDPDGGRFQGYRSHYSWDIGMVVRDWRYIVRIANIEPSEIETAATQTKLYKAMIQALHTVPKAMRGRPVFYCGAAIGAMLDLAAVEKANAALGMREVFGEEVLTFRGIPIRECDAILETEDALV